VSRIMLTGLPEPPDGGRWCAVCVGAYKDGLTHDKRVLPKITEALGDSKTDETARIEKPLNAKYGPLQVAITQAPAVQIPGGPVVDLCWTHAPSIPAGPAGNGRQHVVPSGAIEGLTRGKG